MFVVMWVLFLVLGVLSILQLFEVVDIFSKANVYGFTKYNRDAIIDETHNFGPCTEAVLTLEQLERVLEIGSFTVARSLRKLFDQPQGRIDKPKEINLSNLKELDVYLSQGRFRFGLGQEDYEALYAVRAFVERKGQYWVHDENGLFQLDPFPDRIFKYLRKQFYRMTLLSATFLYLKWYRVYYGIDQVLPEFHFLGIPKSPEVRSQMFVATYLRRWVSSKPKHRTPAYLEWVTKLLNELALIVGDHTLVFVPSYDYLEELYNKLQPRLKDQMSVYKEPETGRIPYIKELLYGPPAVILAVYGGKFNEGVELLDPETGLSRIRFVVLNGLPFPPPTAKYRFLRYMHARRYRHFFFLRWAMLDRQLYTSIHQCLGRAIRSERDRAVGLILDYRILRRCFRYICPFFNFDALINALYFRFIRIKPRNGSHD